MSARPAAGGGHWALVQPERLDGWLARFADDHGPLRWQAGGEGAAASAVSVVAIRAADGSLAECHLPLAPRVPLTVQPAAPFGGLVAHVQIPRRVAVLLVRKGGHGAGVFEGDRLVTSKVGSRRVQGRSAAGGQSQQRFARRRDEQARMAYGAAADVAARVLVPEAARLDAVVTGGSRDAVAAVLTDPRLAPLTDLVADTVLDVPDPRLRVLQQTPRQFRAVRIRVVHPEENASSSMPTSER